MNDANQRYVTVNGSRCRVFEKGQGAPLVVLSGHGGLPRWDRFHDLLSAERRVIAPALPGQFGSERGHDKLHSQFDWLAMTQDLLEACGIDGPVDLVATSASGMLAGELASASPQSLRKLVLVGSYGLYDDAEPTVNLYASAPAHRPGLLAKNKDAYAAVFAPAPEASDADKEEFAMLAYRNEEAVARLVWPFGDFGLKHRTHRIKTPTLLVWGGEDRLVPPSYAKRFADALAGPTQIEIVAGAGHLASVDAPEDVARRVLDVVRSN
jgi:pimeloyl-ACP methyl ester carboxylesterase